ncbi:MAG: LL-diaminopimelate aminotransferase [Elusimicrobia bacterium RIFCSPLOWO2_01_FULL_59_12]|nr:MAG: LL-diaminopimelate aminotransferase [Elusimicrobia bacterium RIFCSPLOWO2_01_FULL_59_12]
MKYSQRIEKLPPYLFAEIDRKKKAAIDRGVDVISLGVGDPDRPTPPHIVKAGQEAMAKPSNHQYPFGAGLMPFRQAIAAFMQRRFNVTLDPASDIYSLIGSKEGLGHLPLAFMDPGQVALVPDPAYPVYKNATLFAGGEPHLMPLNEARGFLPDLGAIPKDILRRARLLFLNYPNNPVAAVAPRAFLEEAVAFAKKNNLVVAYDNAYSEMYFEQAPLSFLEIPGAKDIGIEFHSLSKTFNMTGWRIGWVCGNPELIKGLAQIKDSIDSGAFQAIQEAGIAALNGPQTYVDDMRALYRNRRDLFVDLMRKAGWALPSPPATFYIWAHAPKGFTSTETAGKLLDEAGVVCAPGVGFGPSGEGFVRFALTVDEPRLKQAVERISRVVWQK